MIVYFALNVTTSVRTAKRNALGWKEKDRHIKFLRSIMTRCPSTGLAGTDADRTFFFFLLPELETNTAPRSTSPKACKLHELGILEWDLLVLYQCWPICDTRVRPSFLKTNLTASTWYLLLCGKYLELSNVSVLAALMVEEDSKLEQEYLWRFPTVFRDRNVRS